MPMYFKTASISNCYSKQRGFWKSQYRELMLTECWPRARTHAQCLLPGQAAPCPCQLAGNAECQTPPPPRHVRPTAALPQDSPVVRTHAKVRKALLWRLHLKFYKNPRIPIMSSYFKSLQVFHIIITRKETSESHSTKKYFFIEYLTKVTKPVGREIELTFRFNCLQSSSFSDLLPLSPWLSMLAIY